MQPNIQEFSSEAKRRPKKSEFDISADHPEDSKDQQDLSSKKRQRDWGYEKDSKLSKVAINNRNQQKFTPYDPGQGIFLYKPGVQLPSLFHFSNQTIRVIIASEYIKKYNPEILKRSIYGTDTYTSNSDCVCMAVHSGLVNLNNFSSKRYEGVEISFKVNRPKKNYTGSTKNGITSRNMKIYNGNALKPQSCKNLSTLGEIQNLEKYASNMCIPIGKNRVRSKPKNILNVIPIPETHIVFNMNNEPAYKYSIFNLADKGYEKNQFIIKKLDTHVLYLENNQNEKFQLSKNIENGLQESYRFAKVKEPFKCDNLYFANNLAPLAPELIEIIFPALQWDQITWGNYSFQLKDKVFGNINSFKYHKRNTK